MFVGRERHLADLKRLMRKRTASLVTCRGRRRIGKSTLIKEFGKQAARFLELEGLGPRPGLSNGDQLNFFAQQLASQTDLPRLPLEDWSTAFELLASVLRDEWTVVLLDEISWMGGYDPDFPGRLKRAWDAMQRKHPKLILVLCGSVSAWIDRNILRNTGFVGRDSWDIVLKELPLHKCDRFWGRRRARISPGEKLTLLSVTGGVPKYLEEIDPGISAEENIRHLCFRPGGILFREFEQIFSDVFGKRATAYQDILSSLVHGSKSQGEISAALGKKSSGHMSEYLADLALGGFVSRDVVFSPRTGVDTRKERYRLRDNYARFYLRYVEPHRTRIEKGLMAELSLEQMPGWETISGLQLENLVLSNLSTLTHNLQLGRTPILAAAPFVQTPTKRKMGCQVDLMLLTKRTTYVVEIKRQKRINLSVIPQMQEKLRRLRPDPDRSIRTALVYHGQLDHRVEEERYFDFVIPFDQLLSPPI